MWLRSTLLYPEIQTFVVCANSLCVAYKLIFLKSSRDARQVREEKSTTLLIIYHFTSYLATFLQSIDRIWSQIGSQVFVVACRPDLLMEFRLMPQIETHGSHIEAPMNMFCRYGSRHAYR